MELLKNNDENMLMRTCSKAKFSRDWSDNCLINIYSG